MYNRKSHGGKYSHWPLLDGTHAHSNFQRTDTYKNYHYYLFTKYLIKSTKISNLVFLKVTFSIYDCLPRERCLEIPNFAF